MLPAEMRVIEIAAPGGPEQLRVAMRPVPQPARHEVLVRVAAAGINRPDVMQRQGRYPPPPGASDIPGMEICGAVVALGPDVSSLVIGQNITALLAGGGYAEYAIASVPLCMPIPAGLTPVQAAALPETFLTVWTNVFERGRCKAGDTLLIHGGTSGIGTTAIQLAAAWGARVFATAGSEEKARFCEKLGAVRGINYNTEDFVDVLRRETSDRGADIILDMVGGSYLERNLQAAAVEGRLVIISMLGGARAELKLNHILTKRLTITGSTLRSRSVEEKGAIAAAVVGKVWPLLSEGRIRPIIHATYPMAEAPAAHQLMESSSHIGKILLTM